MKERWGEENRRKLAEPFKRKWTAYDEYSKNGGEYDRSAMFKACWIKQTCAAVTQLMEAQFEEFFSDAPRGVQQAMVHELQILGNVQRYNNLGFCIEFNLLCDTISS